MSLPDTIGARLIYTPIADLAKENQTSPEKIRELVVVAHRGGRFDEPNTLINFKKAINYAQLNPDIRCMIEVDVHQCKAGPGGESGELVVIHDGTVNATTHGKGRVRDFTLEKLQQLRIKPSGCEKIPSEFTDVERGSGILLLPVREEDMRIPSLQEVLDLFDRVNESRLLRGIPLIGVGVDFTHAASKIGIFKDHLLHPLLEQVRPGSQLNKVLPPQSLLNRLAYEICSRNGPTPIQVISQGIHGRRNLCMLMEIMEKSEDDLSIAFQASTSLFPADSKDIKTTLGMGDEKLRSLIQDKRFTINYNHRWDRLAHNLQRFTGFNIRNPYALLPGKFAVSNREAMAKAQAEGILTGFWTVNNSDAIRNVIVWGADMVTTDYPQRAAAIIRELSHHDSMTRAELLTPSPAVSSAAIFASD